MKARTPFVKEGSKKRGKVKKIRRHHKKVLRRIASDLRHVEEALKWEA